MKLHVLLIVGFALGATGCAEKEQAAPEPADETQTAAPAAEPAEPAAADDEAWRSDAFLEHMHVHAEQLDQLNFALADDDLEAALTPSYWLSQHEEIGGIQPEWQPFVDGMREAARAVAGAPDLEAARAAAERISRQCQGCHAAAGIETE